MIIIISSITELKKFINFDHVSFNFCDYELINSETQKEFICDLFQTINTGIEHCWCSWCKQP